MTHVVKPRRYNAERRRQASRRTRRQIVTAARELFLAQGYRATTVADVAARAGVNVDTVYELVGRKPALLRELIEEAISGADHPVAAEQRRYVLRIQAEPDPARKLTIYARAVRKIQERMAPLFLALREEAVVDLQAREVWHAISERRAANMRLLIRDVKAAGGLRPDLSIEDAADTLWLMNSSDVFVLLTRDRGWSPLRFERWLAQTWKRLILP
jgi:AcrR family transcriptional regulator